METASLLASQSYGTVKTALKPAPVAPQQTDKPSFFAQYATDYVQTLQKGEDTAKSAMAGKADAHSVVEALAATELAVQTAVTVRDRIVEAYQEILRMPV